MKKLLIGLTIVALGMGLTLAKLPPEELRKTIKKTTEKFLDASIEFALGELTVESGSARNVFEANLRYNPDEMQPEIEYEIREDEGRLKIRLKSKEDRTHKTWKSTYQENRWELLLSDDLPISLKIDMGLGKGNLDLTDLRIVELQLSTGMSEVTLEFNEPNQEEISRLKIVSGLGKFRAKNLINANFRRLKFENGLGASTLDFRGELEGQFKAEVSVGLGSLTILVPKRFGVRIEAERSFLSTLNLDNFVQKGEDIYHSRNYDKTESRIELDVNIGLGSVNVEWVD